MSNRFTYIGSSYLFLIKDNKILLQRRFQTGFEDGNYGVPAGHLDGNETAREGCAREIKEEIGVDIKPIDLELAHIMHRKADQDERIDFFFYTNNYTGEITNCEPDKCDDLSWFDLDELPTNIVGYVAIALEKYKQANHYSEFGY